MYELTQEQRDLCLKVMQPKEVDNFIKKKFDVGGVKLVEKTLAIIAEAPEPDYRTQRAKLYIKEFSEEGTFQTSVGDVLDVILTVLEQHLEVIPEELQTILNKRAEIKAKFPKEE